MRHGSASLGRLLASAVTEASFQVFRTAAFAVGLACAVALQRAMPHANTRGSSRVNAGLWLVNVAVTAALCGACVCTAARWAAEARVGLLKRELTLGCDC